SSRRRHTRWPRDWSSDVCSSDLPGGDESGVKFRASYTGTVEAFIHIAAARGLASYAVLVGRRGIESAPAQEPRTLGFEPTFQMGGSPTPAPPPPAGIPLTRPSPKYP